MKLRVVVVAFALGLAATVLTAAAHHSVPGTYDITKDIQIQGVVTTIAWRNPHTRVSMDVKSDDGSVSSWELELPGPNALRQKNLDLNFVKRGDQVTVDLWRAKDGSRLGHALALTLPDGRVMNFPRDWGMPGR
jgi:hypothetical protein